MGVLAELDKTGDTRLQWNEDNIEEVESARKRGAHFTKKERQTGGDRPDVGRNPDPR